MIHDRVIQVKFNLTEDRHITHFFFWLTETENVFLVCKIMVRDQNTLKRIYRVITLVHLGGLLSSKAKRAKCSTHKQRVIVMLYNKVCDIVSNMSELLEIQLLTDTTILQVKTKSIYSDRLQFCLSSQKLQHKPYADSCHSFLFFYQVSSMGITPFFVENVSELQLCAIKLVTAVSLHLFYFSL